MGVLDVLTPETMLAPLMLAVKIGSSSSHTHKDNTMQCARRANTSLLHHPHLSPIRRSVIAVLAFTAGCQAFAPVAPAAKTQLRAAAVEEEPEAPKYPTVNVIAAASDNSAI